MGHRPRHDPRPTHFSQLYLFSPSSRSSLVNPSNIFPSDFLPGATSRLRSRKVSNVSEGFWHRPQTTRERTTPPQTRWTQLVFLILCGRSLWSQRVQWGRPGSRGWRGRRASCGQSKPMREVRGAGYMKHPHAKKGAQGRVEQRLQRAAMVLGTLHSLWQRRQRRRLQCIRHEPEELVRVLLPVLVETLLELWGRHEHRPRDLSEEQHSRPRLL